MQSSSVPRGSYVFVARRERASTVRVRANTTRSNYVSFTCGLVTGITQAGVFNPYDRALYLSIKNKSPFLAKENFQRPTQGMLQSLGGRAIAGGLYFPLEHMFLSLVPRDGGAFANFIAGTAAGAANALVLNPISAVKYKTWGREVSRGMIAEAKSMIRNGGIRPFCNGLAPTLIRDVMFGGSYTFLRFQAQELGLKRENQWVANFGAAAVATVVSGPFNLARNIQYGTRTKAEAPTVIMILFNLAHEVRSQPQFMDRMLHLQKRLRIGWGTARVAVGMAFANHVYDSCMTRLEGLPSFEQVR